MTAVFKIDTSEIFCSHCTPLRQGTTGTADVQYPYDFPTYRMQTVTEAVHFQYTSVPFGATETGEQGRSLSKVCTTGTRRNFVKVISFPFIQNCCAPLTDKAALPPSKSRKVRKHPEKVTKCAVCFGFGDISCGLLGFTNGSVGCKQSGDVVK